MDELNEKHKDFIAKFTKRNDPFQRLVFPTIEDLESQFIGVLNDISLELGFDSDMIHHNGFKNQYIYVSCKFCIKFKIKLDFEKDDEFPRKIKFNTMLYGSKHDNTIKHYNNVKSKVGCWQVLYFNRA